MSRKVSNFVRSQIDAEGETVIVRPSATSLFAIDSDDRYTTYAQRRSSPTYPFAFNLQKNEAFLNGFFKRLGLTEFRMNWTLPNISAAWGNNTIQFSYGPAGGPYTTALITIPDGFYDINELADALQTRITALNTSLTDFTVAISDQDYDGLIFETPLTSSIFFYFSADPAKSCRQLIDMLNVPQLSLGVARLVGGVPNLRAMDYVDLVCSQLTYNQELKDASSAPITRDMVARIYLDDPVPSNAFTTVTNYSGTALSTLIITAIAGPTTTGTYILTVTTAPATTIKEGDPVVVSGIGEPTQGGFNARATVIGVPDRTLPNYQVEILYDSPPAIPTTGLTYSGSSQAAFFSTVTTTSIPSGAWSNKVNGVSPFVIYRQFPYPKQIRWNNTMPIGNVIFELYDDQGRSIQDLWNSAYPITFPLSPVGGSVPGYTGSLYANAFVWNCSILVSED